MVFIANGQFNDSAYYHTAFLTMVPQHGLSGISPELIIFVQNLHRSPF
ncbi:hypothetical protein [Acidithiobacillus sulfuriphilus]